MSTSYEAFLPEVLPYMHDCPEFVAVNAIRNACIEFCDKTLYILYEHPLIAAVEGQSTYALALPAGTESARVMEGWFQNLPLTPKSEDDLRRIFPMDWRSMKGRPQYMTHRAPNDLLVCPSPSADADDALGLIVATRPTRDSTTVDDLIYSRWAEQISYGARARLHALPAQPFYDPQAALLYRAMFTAAIGEAKVERNRGLGRTVLRVRPPRLI